MRSVVEADGRSSQTLRVEIFVANDEAARREALQSLNCAGDLQNVTVPEACTFKADGRWIPVSADAIRTPLAPGVPNVPQYGNTRQVVVVLPDVAGGDVVSVTFRRDVIQPLFPGQFTATSVFLPILRWDDAAASISVPDGMTLRTEAFGPTGTVHREDGRTVHRWRWRAPARADDRSPPSTGRRGSSPRPSRTGRRSDGPTPPCGPPRRRSRRASGRWPTRSSRGQPTIARRPGVSATGSPAASAGSRSTWAPAPWVPHAADEVLANGHGDCKDQVTLLIAKLLDEVRSDLNARVAIERAD